MPNTLGDPITVATLGELHFDPENPRLPPEVRDQDERAIFRHLYLTEGVEDILSSLQTNGFVAGEPFLVKGTPGRYVVIEGNRRLTALKALLDGNLRAQLDIKVEPGSLSEAETFPLVAQLIGVETDRRQLIAFLGYKHVAGARAWGPMEKARFIKQHLEDLSLGELSKTIGASRADAQRWLRGLELIDVAEERNLFDYSKRKKARGFGVFYTAVADGNVQAFIGLEGEKYEQTDQARLREVLLWILGEQDESRDPPSDLDPILNDSREISNFGKILVDEKALRMLREVKDFNQAKSVVGGFDHDLAELLRQANNSSLQAYFVTANATPGEVHKSLLVELGKTVDRLKKVIGE